MPGRRLSLSARLPAHLKCKLVYNGLDRLGRTRMFFDMVEHDRKHKGTGMLLQWHPFIGEHYAWAVVYTDNVMVVSDQLLRLLARTDCHCLVGRNLIERFWHPVFILQGSNQWKKGPVWANLP